MDRVSEVVVFAMSVKDPPDVLVVVCHFCIVPTCPLKLNIAFWFVQMELLLATTVPALRSMTVTVIGLLTVVHPLYAISALKEVVFVRDAVV